MLMLNQKRSGGTQQQQQQQAPVPPQRHSSIRANAPLTPPTHMANSTHNFGSNGGLTTGAGAGAGAGAGTGTGVGASASVGRLVIDLEAKFGKRFHNVTEFPKPPPFLNIQKVYPSRTLKATNEAALAPNSNNNNNNNNNSTATCNNNAKPTTGLKPAYAPLKKHRAPAPPPQAGVAAATVSVIRQSSFLYGGNGAAGGGVTTAVSVRPKSQPATSSVPHNSTVY